MKLVVATNNKHKLVEFCRILEPLGFEVLSQKEAGVTVNPVEDGETFAANAKIKAMAVYEACGLPSVADDSGLCVDAMNGGPGVYSARYLGEDTAQEIKNAGILKELENVPADKRGANFACAICCVVSKEDIIECEGKCNGSIGYEPKGDGGFGYDPIFMVGDRSYAELSPEEKDAISHRGRALEVLHGILKEKFEK